MLINIDENSNCDAVPGRVFQEQGAPQPLVRIRQERQGNELWCDVIAVDPDPIFKPALVRKVDDSGDGSCFLVYGGAWGIRLRNATLPKPWSLTESEQWGQGFALLPADGTDLQYTLEIQLV